MNGKKCGADCGGCESCKPSMCGSCAAGSCGSGCGCGHRGMKILVKLAILAIVFWAGTEFGEKKALMQGGGWGMRRGTPIMIDAGTYNPTQ